MTATRTARYRLILLAVDGSEASRVAAAHAAYLAGATSAAVAVLAVMDTSAGFTFGAEGAAAYARLRAEAQAAIEVASAMLREAGVARVEHLIMDGVPRDAIREVADEQGADLIVLSAMRDDTAGDAVTPLVCRAHCPILIVPMERIAR